MKFAYYLNWIWTSISISYIIVYHYVIEKALQPELLYKVGFTLLPMFFIWLMLFMLTFWAGYPNNEVKRIIYIDSTRYKNKELTIYVKEIERSKWQVVDNNYNEILDMKGWVKQKRLITNLIKTKLMLDVYNRMKPKVSALPFGNQYSSVKDLCLIFVPLNGKEWKKTIIKDNKVVKSFYLRVKSFFVARHKPYKPEYFEYSLKDFYIIRKTKKNRTCIK